MLLSKTNNDVCGARACFILVWVNYYTGTLIDKLATKAHVFHCSVLILGEKFQMAIKNFS